MAYLSNISPDKKVLYMFNSYHLYLEEMEEKTNKAKPRRRFKKKKKTKTVELTIKANLKE